MKNVLFVHDHYFVTWGDQVYSDKLPYSTWQRYLDAFDSVTVFARQSVSRVEPESLSLSSGPNVNFAFAPSLSSVGMFVRNRRQQRDRLRRILECHDRVIVRLPSEYGLLAASIAKTLGKPYLVEVVGSAWDAYWNYGHPNAKAYAPVAEFRMRSAVAAAPMAIYVSQFFLQRRYPPARGAVVAAISNVELPAAPDLVAEARQKKIESLSGDRPFIVGLIGSLKTRYKGVHTAIEAMGKFSERNSRPIQLRVLGGGPTAEYAEVALKTAPHLDIRFDGLLPSGDPVFKWLDAVDLYVQPSYQEGVPRALIEAMSRGCPALASSAGGIPELLPAQCLFAPGDSAAMARLMLAAVDDRAWMKAQASRNFEEAKKYNRDKLAAIRRDVLRRLRDAPDGF